MVRALADWFAVTALFRHPLNIPIPLQNLCNEIKAKNIDELKTPESQVRKQIETGIVTFGRNLANNNHMQERINTWLYD